MTKWLTSGVIVLASFTVGTVYGTRQVQTAHAQVAREGEVTLVGCIELERDYRARKGGRSGGSGVGVGNEFVLVNAKPAQAGRRGAAGTATGDGIDYELAGKLEKDFIRYVGRQVEVTGTVSKGSLLSSITVTLWHPVGDYCPGT